MLQQDEPADYVIGSGVLRSVEELCEMAFRCVDLDYRDYVTQDPRFYRQIEHYDLVADPSNAKQTLGWKPEVDFPTLIKSMVDHDLALLDAEDQS